MLISLIIVNYNGADLLPACCSALLHTTYHPYEVIVVDNASSDDSLAFLSANYPQFRVIANPDNHGFGAGCNLGAAAANGAAFVFLNPDVIVTPEWLSHLVRRMEEYPDAAILCPTTLRTDQTMPHYPAPVEEKAAVPGAALLLRRDAWQEIGGFDEQMFLYWEDTELCWRAWLLGWRVLVDLRGAVYHDHGGSSGFRRWDEEQTKNALYTYLKLLRWRHVIPFALLLLLKTLAKVIRFRNPQILRAWQWNFRMLGRTLAQRRALHARRRIDWRRLETLIAAYNTRQRRELRERAQQLKASR